MKVLTEEGTYVDLEEEKEYSVVTFLLGLNIQILGNASHFCR